MPSQRRLKVFGLLAAIVILTIFYVSNSAHSTQTSEFYSRTVAALDTKSRAAQEALDLENHKKIQAAAEADAAQKAKDRDPDSPIPAVKEKEQKPFAVDVEEAGKKAQNVAANVVDAAKDAVHGVTGPDSAEKSVAGRKMMKGIKDDGVAKVGNSGAKDPASEKKAGEDTKESDEAHDVEVELNAILKKSPSKSALVQWQTISVLTITQSSYSPRATARTRRRPSTFCLTSTVSCRHLMWRNWICTHSACGCRLRWRSRLADERYQTFSSMARALVEATMLPTLIPRTSWRR